MPKLLEVLTGYIVGSGSLIHYQTLGQATAIAAARPDNIFLAVSSLFPDFIDNSLAIVSVPWAQ